VFVDGRLAGLGGRLSIGLERAFRYPQLGKLAAQLAHFLAQAEIVEKEVGVKVLGLVQLYVELLEMGQWPAASQPELTRERGFKLGQRPLESALLQHAGQGGFAHANDPFHGNIPGAIGFLLRQAKLQFMKSWQQGYRGRAQVQGSERAANVLVSGKSAPVVGTPVAPGLPRCPAPPPPEG